MSSLRFIRPFTVLLILLFHPRRLSCAQVDESIKHFAYSLLDQFRVCAESVLKKHVLTDWVIGHELEKAKCPLKDDDLESVLKSSGHTILTNGDWAFIVPAELIFVKQTQVGSNRTVIERPWKNLLVQVTITKAIGSKSPLSPDQLSDLKAQLLSRARFLPMWDTDENFTNQTAIFRLWYQVYVLPMRKDGPVSVVVLERQSEAPAAESAEDLEKQVFLLPDGRIIYGEMQNGKVRVLWDSPLVQVRYMKQLDFQDVDGDGNQEILVRGSFTAGMAAEWQNLSIFNWKGEEISRQSCSNEEAYGHGNPYGERACAIFSTGDIALDCASLPCKIEAPGAEGDPEESYTFFLKNGHYSSVSGSNSKSAEPAKEGYPTLANPPPTAAALNAEGLALMKKQKYQEASIKFAEASKGDPKNAEYANNAGYSHYKWASYQMAEVWLDTAIQLDPKRAVAYLNLGDTLVKLNHNAEARQAYMKYLELAPNSKSAAEVKKKLDALSNAP